MLVKLKDPSRVYYDRAQEKSFSGDGNISTKVTAFVREMLNNGAFTEVTIESPSTAEGAAKAKLKLGDKKVETA